MAVWNEGFRCQPQRAGDAHRALPPRTNLDSVLSIRESRTVTADYTVRWEGVIYRVEREQIMGAHARSARATGAMARLKQVDAVAKPNRSPLTPSNSTTRAS